ncbi:TetR/AcrR family transcriptional regulator [Brevibacillus reuszeri]|uniref:TetR/AcrR family transcriptional regulator n=1 Tax=Brevibacillus reuszeri TaxID=54915 RepID=UPI00289CD988|nr:TetR/AcrR family transcriptional regulator [Brevibacillus reuszeri]
MPKNNFELLSDEKKEAIFLMAKDLFSEYSFDEISMEILTDKLSLPAATFYRYFKDKEDLFITFLNWYGDYDELSEDFIRNPKEEKGERSLADRRLIHTIRNAPESTLLKLYFGKYKDATKSVFLKELLKLKYGGMLREDIDPDLIAYMYGTTMYNLQLYFREMGLNSLEDVELCSEIARNFYQSFFRYGIMKPDSAE